MNLSLKLSAFLLCLLPFQTWAQSIEANLRYINQQFSIYNEYETSFRVDEAAKLLICEDRFGILKAPFSEVEVRTEGVNVGIFCLNNSEECIKSYSKTDENSGSGYTDYTMGLGEDGELIPHVQVVLDKFAELKQLVVSSNTAAVATGNVVADVQAELNIINGIFQRSSEYKNVFSVDFATNLITARTQNCRAVFPANNDTRIYYYKRDGSGSYNEGYYIENTNKEILVSCTSFENYNYKSYEYLNNAADAQRVVQSLNRIVSLLSAGGSNGASASIDQKISEINAIFQRSSEYKNVYSVDLTNKQIIGKTENCQVVIPIRSGLSINAYDRDGSYGNGFFFKNVDKSILESCTSFSDYTEQTYEYVDNATDSRTVISHFNSIINELLNGGGGVSSSSNPMIIKDLKYINEQFAQYNEYETSFKVEGQNLVCEDRFGILKAPISAVEVRTEGKNMGIFCLDADNKCIIGHTKEGAPSGTDYSSYTMGLGEDGELVPHIQVVLDKFVAIKNAMSSSAASGSSYSGGNSVSEHMAYINEQFAKYNAYNTRFSINSNAQLVWTHDFGTNYANLKDVEVRIDPNNNFIGVYCLNSNNKCIWQIDKSGNRTEYNSYTMSLKENDAMISHINTVIEKFAAAKRLTLGAGMPASGTNAPTDSPD